MAESITYILEVRDRFSAALKKVDSRIGKVKDKLNRASMAVGNFGKKLRSLGAQANLRFTAPLLAGLGLSLKAWNKQEQAIAQVQSGLKATQGTAGRTLEQLTAMASKLQSETLFGDEKILAGATAQLLTFTNIAGDNFDRTQVAVLDVATKLAATNGGVADLTSTAIMLGKALNDPVANLGALSRSGIQFSEQQKAVIKALVKSNRLADAQAMILNELERQYGGASKAAALAGTGPLTQAMNILGDAFEDFGAIFAEMLMPVIPGFKEAVVNVRAWMNENKALVKTILKISLVLAGLFSALLAFGIAAGIVSFALAGFAKIGVIFTALQKSTIILTAAYKGLAFVIGLAKTAMMAFGVTSNIAMAGIPIAITAIIAGLVILQKKFQVFTKLFSKIKSIGGVVGALFGRGFPSEIKSTQAQNPVSNISSTNVFQKSSVDISGGINVTSTPDLQVDQAKIFDTNTGQNFALGGI